MRKIIIIAVICLLGLAGSVGYAARRHTGAPPAHKTSQTKAEPKDTFDKTAHSLTDPGSIWVVVNKQHPMDPVSYVPTQLAFPNVSLRIPGATEMKMQGPAVGALEQMFAAATQSGYKLEISTAYRGYAYQKTLYDGYVANLGQAQADQQSARPGYSEHQTGLAVDIHTVDNHCNLEACFGDLPEGKWLAANAHTYGFILRYPADKTPVTGYEYEPWHFRYVGTDLSEQMYKQHIKTLEEFFGVTGGAIYK